MTTQHTPAPWISRPVPSDSVDGKISYRIDTENGAPLADVRTRPDDEHTSNALLIAAAPDLLDALKALFENCEMIHRYWGEIDNSKQANNAIKAARVAIRKAEGD